MHLAAAIPNFLIFENMYPYNPLSTILKNALPQPIRGTIKTPVAPGLGVKLDEEALKVFSNGKADWRRTS